MSTIIFSAQDMVWCIKSRTHLSTNLSSKVRFSKITPSGCKTWHAWSHEQCFSKHFFLDYLSCAFKESYRKEMHNAKSLLNWWKKQAVAWRRSWKFRKVHRRTPVLESLFLNKAADWKTLLRRDSSTGNFLWTLRNSQEHFF